MVPSVVVTDSTTDARSSRLLVSVAASVIIITGLRAAADVVNPVLLALLLALCLAPALSFLMTRGVKKALAVTLLILAFLTIAGVTTATVAHSASALLRELPQYEARTGESLGTFRATLESHGVDVDTILPSGEEGARRLVDSARSVVRAILHMVSEFVVVALLTVLFVMEIAQEEGAPARSGPLAPFFDRVHEAAAPIRRYMGITALAGAVNAILNLVLLLGIRVPHPGLFAVVAFFFHFVPGIGNLLSLIPPTALALVALGPKHALAVFIGYIVINTLVESVLKPAVLAKGLDVTIVELVLSLLAWGFVFGPLGAILAVPLTLAARYLLLDRPQVQVIESASEGP